MNINDYKKEYDELELKCNLSGEEALEVVKRDGYALQYVKDQTPEICLEAVKRNNYVLQYVNEDIFTSEEEMTLEEVCKELGRTIKIIK